MGSNNQLRLSLVFPLILSFSFLPIAHSSSCRSSVQQVAPVVKMDKPIFLSTRLEVYAQSSPIPGRPDLVLYHVQKNRHYETWMKKVRDANPDATILDFPLTTEVTPKTKKLINFFFFKEKNEGPNFGSYFETLPSPELFEYQRQAWNSTHGPRKQIHVRATRRSKGDGQKDMARLWEDSFQVGIGIMEPELGNQTILRKLPPENRNLQMNTDPSNFTPKLVKIPGTNKMVIEDTHQLLLHDVGQWVNMLWVDRATIEATRNVADFYVKLRQITHTKGREIPAPLLPEVRKDLAVGETTANGIYSAHRFLLDALHDSQRGVHSFTHMIIWLLRQPQGFVPGVDFVNDHGPIVIGEIRNHLQGMGVKTVAKETPPVEDLNFARTWNMAQPSAVPFKLMDGLKFLVNRDRERAALVGETISGLIPEAAQLYQEFKAKGAFKPASQAELESMLSEMQYRYENLGR